jgi:murein DD-endopeptidase MepM/ murein hydrolase activator NlpD
MTYLNLDFKSDNPLERKRRITRPKIHPNRLIRGFTTLLAVFAAFYLLLNLLPDSIARVENSTPKEQRLHYPVRLPAPIDAVDAPPAVSVAQDRQDDPRWSNISIKSGDTLASIFSSAGLKASVTHAVANLNKQTAVLTKIKPGQIISLLINEQEELINLKYQPDITQTLVVKRQQDGKFTSELQHHPLEPIPVYKSGVIESSLFLAAAESDIPDNIIMELAGIFGWDIDFALDIRKGDHFSVVYNELFKDGVKIRTGRILAAEFVNRGKTFQAVYYTDPKGDSGYFTPEGKSMRKAFLRAPVDFRRISSRFTRERWHPVLGKKRPHRGVDYAARVGTPIRAAGDGKITFRGTKGGYGSTVIIQHGGIYTTLYAHMSRFAKGKTKGNRVKQGDVIGYVGKSGLATGPHLHYEFRVNGVHRNPLTVKLPAAEPIDQAYQAHFQQHSRTYLSMLELMAPQQLAQSSTSEP